MSQAVRSARPAGFRDVLRAEWTKFRTAGGTGWLLLAAANGCAPVHGGCLASVTGTDPAKVTLTGVYLGQAVVAVLAALAIGGEYDTGMIRVTLAAAPRRLTLLAAKTVIVTGYALAAGVIAAGGSFLAGRLIEPGRGLTAANGYLPLSLGNGADLRAVGGTVLYLILVALLAFGITTAVRDSAVGIGIVLGLLYLFPIITAVVPDHTLARHLEQIAPMTAGLYIQATVGVGFLPLTPWQGLGITALWAAGALLLGALALRLRDA
jgi:ABC-2 type transport system permease protein